MSGIARRDADVEGPREWEWEWEQCHMSNYVGERHFSTVSNDGNGMARVRRSVSLDIFDCCLFDSGTVGSVSNSCD